MSSPPPLPQTDAPSASPCLTLLLSVALLAFVGSGLISFLSDALLGIFQRQDLAVAAALAWFLMLLLGGLIYLLMALTPRVPKRIFLPISLYLPVTMVGVLPLLVYFPDRAVLILCAVSLGQVLLGSFLIGRIRGALTFHWPIFPETHLKRCNFRWGNLITMLSAAFFLIIPGLLLYLAFSAKLALAKFTDGFVKLGPSGIFMEVRKYSRDDGKKITLMPMSHVGEVEFYQELAASFPENPVVLMEGVSDSEKTLNTHSDYSKMAQAVGGVEQVRVFKPRGEIVAADVDISSFSPATRELLKNAMMLHAKGVTAETLPILMKPTPPGLEKQLIDDILTKRNHHLLEMLKARLPSSEHIVVPWGAAHMPEIAREIQKLGFHQAETQDFRAIRFGP